MTIHYTTPTLLIGKHEWRCIVRDSDYHGRVTEFQWKQAGQWQPDTEWPTYNHNDGVYAGLPKTLRRIYQNNHEAIHAALDNRPTQKPRQRELGL